MEKGERQLQNILSHILIRRTRNHILRWYGYDSETHTPVDPFDFEKYLQGKRRAYIHVAGNHCFFPKRELGTIEYSIENTYQGLYQQLRGYLGKSRTRQKKKSSKNELCYARYGLGNYVVKSKRNQEPYISLQSAGANLRGLMRVLLFKRFESSVYAFRKTVQRLLKTYQYFDRALEEGFIPVGEDAAILDREEQLNEEAMYAIYEQDQQLSLFESPEDSLDLNENEAGEIISREVPRILATLKTQPQEKALSLPQNYNATVMQIKRQFEQEVQHRASERDHTTNLNQGQRYVSKELRAYYETVSDAETRQTIDLLDQAFRQPMTNVLRRELNAIKREGLTNTELIARLKQLYHQHNMGEWRDTRKWEREKPIATIICSQAFV